MNTKESTASQRIVWAVAAVVIVGWLLFSYGYVWQYIKVPGTPLWRILGLVSLPILPVIVFWLTWRARDKWRGPLIDILEAHTNDVDALPDSRTGLWIALAVGLGLYSELMIIRLHASFFLLFAYFKNVSLLSCFLGLGIGYARGSRRPLPTPLFFPLLAAQIAFLYFLRFQPVAFFLQNPIPEHPTLGMGEMEHISHMFIVFGLLALVFALNALCFVPLGQLASRLMMRRQNLTAYNWNLIGSLGGIALFWGVSFAWAPPLVWVLPAAFGLIAFLRKPIEVLITTAIAVVVLQAVLGISVRPNRVEVYSPYQILTLTVTRNAPLELQASNAYYQRLLDLRPENQQQDRRLKEWADHYALPYFFKPEPRRVLVVGSGTGNDVAAALRHGARKIDAVEIDPAILHFGKILHPESPYQDKNVRTIVNDARTFIRYTDSTYDLIVYGLLDSHTLLSGMSSIRLDGFVYTVEALREARARLREGGMICLTFSLIKPELGRKLYLMLQEAFDGRSPVVFQTGYDGGFAFLTGNAVDRSTLPQSTRFHDVTVQFTDSGIRADVSTDDWPFFYMPARTYPLSYLLMIVLLAVISLVFVLGLTPGSGKKGFSLSCFFLGVGFMLVETKGITELALLFGSTWIVISAVIAGILLMAFLANQLVLRKGAPPPLVTYGLLFLSLGIGLYSRTVEFTTGLLVLNQIIMTLLLTLPIFFSGFAFSTELGRSISIPGALSSNLLGAMLGGFLEYNSMYFGFQFLYILAFAAYGIALIGSLRAKNPAGGVGA